MFWQKALLVTLYVLLSACSAINTNEHANQLAEHHALKKQITTNDGFVLTAYTRLNNPNLPVNVYIEGDGLAWFSRYELSTDPTPREAIGLALAAQDNASNVLYLARPCQFNDFKKTPCNSAYWSNQRFSQKVVTAMNNELQTLISANNSQKIHLIGYSGGAAIAVLLAAQRNDVLSLRTVAGNLDHAYVNQFHHVNLMPESLNAIDVASKISSIPQLHFIGINDKVIPKEVAKRFTQQQESTQEKTAQCAAIIEVDADHQKGWVTKWQKLLQQAFPCQP
ncbi:alpha/beta hydrolase [Methylotenera sp.]|uniref:alpha/beta fold hydrolase n=1 Tax=Methylotenera sp. TaxID=2051956 RepID=UPI0024880142|nr:alpha/beta hydrolase [Methylotenera sp.]MDI1298691.1 alpha/beta hydrolase [Methylotenera sp.]